MASLGAKVHRLHVFDLFAGLSVEDLGAAIDLTRRLDPYFSNDFHSAILRAHGSRACAARIEERDELSPVPLTRTNLGVSRATIR